MPRIVSNTNWPRVAAARKKILHVTGLAHGGSGEHILTLCKATDRARFELTVAMAAESPARVRFEEAGLRVVPLALDHAGSPRRNLVAFGQLVRLMRRERFDLVHTHTSVAGALGRVAAKLAGSVKTVHMLHSFASHDHVRQPARRLALAAERGLDQFTDHYIAASRAMIERGLSSRIFARGKVSLISNAIDFAAMEVSEGVSREFARRELKLASDEIAIGFLGRLERAKGCEYLLRAAACLKYSAAPVTFIICGDGALREQLEKLASELNVNRRVRFLGWRSNFADVLKAFDFVAMPSLWESFGLAALEAMALGKPVVASAVDGLAEVVEHGITGLHVPPGDPEALAEAIETLAADREVVRQLGSQAAKRVRERFSLERMIESHERLYCELIDGHDATPSESVVRKAA